MSLRPALFSHVLMIAWANLPAIASAQETAAQAMRQSFTTQLFFWSTAFVLVFFLGRVMFREQLSERRTIRRLTDEIGPYYPEFEIPAITHWVKRCAPHIWSGWSGGSLVHIEDFVTADFLADAERQSGESGPFTVEAKLTSVIKVHTVLLMGDKSQEAPDGIELVLRIEQRGIYCTRDAKGTVTQGSPKETDVQHFWTLRYYNRGWLVHRVWLAEGDFKAFPEDRDVPHISQWRLP